MTKTILQRIFLLADAPCPALCLNLARVLRKLGGADDSARKAGDIAAMLRGLSPADQDAILRGVESLRDKP
ncbi:MAG TPA: hypothetical protein VK573_09425 [Gemmatimonadales bacterium]|nr:hypothetical protein [Gemmatimonadales bacterium]